MHKGNVALTLVTIMAIGAFVISGYVLYKTRVAPLYNITPATVAIVASTPTPVATSYPTPTPTPAASPKVQVNVVWESVSAEDKTTLQTRVADPFLDYYAQANLGKLTTLTISANTKGTHATYPYLGEGKFEGGGTVGFVIEKPIKWWTPECMGQCPVNAAFKAKYPEIMAILGY